MKIRNYLIVGFFILAFTPLMLFVGINMPRVLARFKAAEENRQLLSIQADAREILMNMKWEKDSLRALSFNIGAIEIASKSSTDFPAQVIKKRVQKMISRWYQDNPEIISVQLLDRQGVPRFAVSRKKGSSLVVVPANQVPSCPSDMVRLADLHPDGTAYNAGVEVFDSPEQGQRQVMRLGAALQNKGEVVGAACLALDLSSLLQHYSGTLVQYNPQIHKYVQLFESENPIVDFGFLEGLVPNEPVMINEKKGQTLAFLPFFTDGHISENIQLIYPIKTGSTMVWVHTWRKQVLFLFCFVFIVICLVAMKLSTVLDRFSKELLTVFQDLLHQQRPVTFSWSGPEEIQSLSRDLNALSRQYLESIKAQEIMSQEACTMERELRQSQKMKALGLLAGGVAHDLNNILSGVVSYPQLLLLQLPEESELRKPILEIQRSGERAAAVVADLLTVARGVASKKECSNLNHLILEYLDSPECREQLKLYPEISCCKELCLEELPVLCSPVHIKKTLMNLVNNATESIRGKGKIIISTKREQLFEKDLAGSSLLPGEYAILQIQDTGPGISEDDLEHIFEPFYSNKKMGRSGTGLGLTVVWNTMNDHDGRVKVNSSPKGTCFELFFPLDKRIERQNQDDSVERDLQGNGEHILVIDDDSLQRDLAVRILEVYGYKVETVPSGEEAIQFLRTHESDLLLLDMVMEPGINGYETYREILKIHPSQKAIIVSGFSESQLVEETKKLGATHFVKKPYAIELLSQTVQEALHEFVSPSV